MLFLCCCQELFYEDRHYHEHCFRCFRCDRSLADEPFTSQDEALLCNDCYCNEFSSKCVACDKIVMPGEGWQEHILCFQIIIRQLNRTVWLFLYHGFLRFIAKCSSAIKSTNCPSAKAFFFFSLSPFFCVPSVRYEEVGVCGFDVARRLLHLSQLWTAHWLQVFHPWQGWALLCGLLRRQVCPSVRPL